MGNNLHLILKNLLLLIFFVFQSSSQIFLYTYFFHAISLHIISYIAIDIPLTIIITRMLLNSRCNFSVLRLYFFIPPTFFFFFISTLAQAEFNEREEIVFKVFIYFMCGVLIMTYMNNFSFTGRTLCSKSLEDCVKVLHKMENQIMRIIQVFRW